MKQSISKVDSLSVREESFSSQQTSDVNQFLLNNKNHVYELINLVKHLQEYNLLTIVNDSLENHSNQKNNGFSMNTKDLDQLIHGVKKGIEEGSANMESGKDINAFQLMKLLKDPDINRAINFLTHFLRGMGKSLE